MKKFTLIELLVVVAIIGILASLLMPSLAKSREKARIKVCMNHLKQINTAAFLYIDDSEGYYPGANAPDLLSWDDRFGTYDGRNLTQAQQSAGGRAGKLKTDPLLGENHGELYRCPLDDRTSGDFLIRTYGPTQMWTPGPGSWEWDASRGISGSTTAGGNPPISRSIDAISKPSQVIAFTELVADFADDWWHQHRARLGSSYTWVGIHAASIANTAMPPHHSTGKFNFAMADGHVEPMSIYQSLVRGDGSLAAASDTRQTKWDSLRD